MSIKVNIKISLGNHGWCSGGGNIVYHIVKDENGPRMVKVENKLENLPEDEAKMCKSGYYFTDKGKHMKMVRLNIQLAESLFGKTDIVEIIDESGFLAQYTTTPLKSPEINMFFGLNYVDFGSKLKVCCRKILPFDQNKWGTRAPMETIESVEIEIPPLIIKGSSTCSICLNNTLKSPDIQYVSECGHSFCTPCIWEYIESKNKAVTTPRCKAPHCEHEKKTKPFQCPICDTLLCI